MEDAVFSLGRATEADTWPGLPERVICALNIARHRARVLYYSGPQTIPPPVLNLRSCFVYASFPLLIHPSLTLLLVVGNRQQRWSRLLIRLLLDRTTDALCDPSAPSVHILDPEVARTIDEGEVNRQHGEQPCSTRKLEQRARHPLSRGGVLHRLGNRETVDHPAEHRSEELVVQEVDGEGDLAEEQERLGRKDISDGWREVDGHDDKIETEAGRESWKIGVAGEDGQHEVDEGLRPGLPLEVGVGQGCDEESGDEEEGGEEHAHAGQTRFLREERGPGGARALRQLLQVGHEGAKEELHTEEGVVGGGSEPSEAQGDHHPVSGLNVCGGNEVNEDPEGTLENGHHGPQLSPILALAMRPNPDHVREEGNNSLDPAVAPCRACLGKACSVTVLCCLECAELGGKAARGEDDEDGQYQARNTTKG